MTTDPTPTRPRDENDECATCGHRRRQHIYREGACRPGFTCPKGCVVFVDQRVASVERTEPTLRQTIGGVVTFSPAVSEMGVADARCLIDALTDAVSAWSAGVSEEEVEAAWERCTYSDFMYSGHERQAFESGYRAAVSVRAGSTENQETK